jgi:hypothetical protein
LCFKRSLTPHLTKITGIYFDPYATPVHAPVSTSPFNVPLSSAEQSKKENKADIPKNIGFRGRHFHRKMPDDPVYPTKKIPPQLRPKTLIDWRTGGRAMLVAGMALLERRMKLRKRVEIMNWQKQGPCVGCGFACAKEKRRIFCGWKVPNTQFEHFNALQRDIRSYKGIVMTEKPQPIFKTMRQVAEKNAVFAEKWKWNGEKIEKIGVIHGGNKIQGSFDDDPEHLDSDDEPFLDEIHQKEAEMYSGNFHL